MGRVMDSYFLALTAIVTGTNSRMEVKGFGRIRYAYSFARLLVGMMWLTGFFELFVI